MPRPRRGTNLTLKEQGFVMDVVKTKNIKQSVKRNYNVKNDVNASNLGFAMLRNPRIQYAIADLMDRLHMKDENLLLRLHELTNARKQVVTKSGDVIDVNDNPSSVKALDMAFKLKGAYAPERHEHLKYNVNLYKDLSDDELDAKLRNLEAREAIVARGEGEAAGKS